LTDGSSRWPDERSLRRTENGDLQAKEDPGCRDGHRRFALERGALFFVVFFGLSLTYYVRAAIFVDEAGLTYRGIVRTERLTFDDIRKVDVLPGPVTVYAVRGRGRFVHFTSFFRHHQRLVELLIERAGLAPIRS
jgi:hypothetical protein